MYKELVSSIRLRVGMVDDHAAVVLGVSAIFRAQDDVAMVIAAATVVDLLSADVTVDVVLLDLLLSDGSTPASNLRLLRPLGVPVIAYTSGEHPALVRQAARHHVAGMIRKSQPASVLLDAVRAAARGEVVASQDWAAAIDSDSALPSAGLTSREAEVLEWYASGETAASVADHLHISRETVLDHLRRIRAKYAAVDRIAVTKVDLYKRATEDGFVDPGGTANGDA